VGLTCEYVTNPKVVDRPEPRLAWINSASGDFRGQQQTGYQIRVASTKDLLPNPDLWDSGKVDSEQSNHIEYQGTALGTGQDCWWQVRTWDKDGLESEWSEPAYWGMGMMDANQWQATWIGAPWQGEEALPEPGWPDASIEKWPPPAPYFRKTFTISKEVAQAKVYATGLGYFELYVNGAKQGDEVLVPNQTNYGKRDYLLETNIPLPDDFQEYKVMYLSYDITDQLETGDNVMGVILGNGFYDASKYWSGSYGSPRFLGQLHITYLDGSEEIITSDDSWKVSQGPILRDMVFYGEIYDARLEMPGWHQPAYDDMGWESAVVREAPFGKLVAHTPYPDKVMESLEPVSIEKQQDGRYIVDFGVEISGWVRLKEVDGPAGHKIDLKFISNTPSGDNTYILNGSGSESYAPRFNWFVFSAVEVINWPGELTKSNLVAEAVNTFIDETAVFETSNPMFNQINQIWKRSQLDNMHGGIVSDCPHRERSPYTGDGQVACATVMHNFDARSFYDKWIADIRGAQVKSTGYVPNCAPWQPGCGGGVAWGSAICIIPWQYYLHYGNQQVLEENIKAMQGFVDYLRGWLDQDGIMHLKRTGRDGNILKWFNLGEWGCYNDQCPPDEMVHTYFLWKCTDILVKSADVLGRSELANQYSSYREQTSNAFQLRFYDQEKGNYGNHGANVFALDMGVPDSERSKVVAALKQILKENEGHLHTGIYGSRLLFEVLSDNGLHQMAYEALNKTTEPGFGYWLADGATTTREFWNNEGSHNHPMFGGGLTWFYRKLAGMEIDPAEPGYRHIIYKPHTVPEISYVKYFNQTVLGDAGIHWKQSPDHFTMEVKVPIGSTATVFVPGSDLDSILESGHSVKDSDFIRFVEISDDGYVILKVPSGIYRFEST
jgi:alpha-L-rhamnosidase